MNWWPLGISDASNLIFSPGYFSPRKFKLLKGCSSNCFEQKRKMLWKIISRYYTVMLCSFAMICVFLSGLGFWELHKLHNTHSGGGQRSTMGTEKPAPVVPPVLCIDLILPVTEWEDEKCSNATWTISVNWAGQFVFQWRLPTTIVFPFPRKYHSWAWADH